MRSQPSLAELLGADPYEAEDVGAGFTRTPEAPGLVDDLHYSAFADDVKAHKRAGRLGQAEALLLRLVAAVEEEARAEGWGVAPWYYEQLAIVYARLGEVGSEIQILERFVRQSHARGAGTARLLRRLERRKGRA